MMNFKYQIKLLITGIFITTFSCAFAQEKAEKETERMIGASRGAAPPLLFKANLPENPLIGPGEFHNDNETLVRGGLGNFFSKLNHNHPVTIGYIGGSITEAYYGYRLQSAKYIQTPSPGTEMQFLNAGVSGTGTDLGSCRIQDQILSHHPDLIFIEFAVNGAYQEGLEGMIRKIIKNNSKTDICLLYTILGSHTSMYINNEIPENIKGLEKVATYYGLPSIHLGMEAAYLEKERKLIWKGNEIPTDGSILFSNDGVHPTMQGGNLYAAAVARGMNKLKSASLTTVNHPLTKAMFFDNWEDAQMVDPIEFATFSTGWIKTPAEGNARLGQFKAWFPYLMYSNKPGESFSFKFTGTMFGFYDLGGPDVGQVTIKVDGKPAKLGAVAAKGALFYKILSEDTAGDSLINRFNAFCNNRYRGQYEFIAVEPGTHYVSVTLSPVKADKAKILGEKQQADINEHPEKYNQTALYLGKILIKGKINKP